MAVIINPAGMRVECDPKLARQMVKVHGCEYAPDTEGQDPKEESSSGSIPAGSGTSAAQSQPSGPPKGQSSARPAKKKVKRKKRRKAPPRKKPAEKASGDEGGAGGE